MSSNKPQQRQKSPLQAKHLSKNELEYAYKIRIVEQVGQVLYGLAKWGAIAWGAYCVYLTVDSLAGRDTLAKIGFDFMASMTWNKWAAYAFGGGGALYGLNQRRLRRNAVRRLAPGRIEYEQALDPNRSSSGLTKSGDTNPAEM